MAKKLLSFSVPLMLAAIGAFYLTFGDRYFLRIFWDLTEVGIYALGYKFGFILIMLTWTPFEQIWDSQKYEIYEKPNAKTVFQRTFLVVSGLMIFAALAISLLAKDLLRVMSDPAFYRAHEIVPIVLIAYVIQAWTAYCYFGIYLKRNTLQITYGTLLAAAVITVAYLTLIPVFGVHGAAWATVVGFTARFVWTYRKATAAYDMELPWRKVALIAVLAVAIFGVSEFAPADLIASLATRLALLLLFVIIVFFLPVLSASERAALIELAKHPSNFRHVLG